MEVSPKWVKSKRRREKEEEEKRREERLNDGNNTQAAWAKIPKFLGIILFRSHFLPSANFVHGKR